MFRGVGNFSSKSDAAPLLRLAMLPLSAIGEIYSFPAAIRLFFTALEVLFLFPAAAAAPTDALNFLTVAALPAPCGFTAAAGFVCLFVLLDLFGFHGSTGKLAAVVALITSASLS